jgi:hypothetical protein
MRWLAVWIVLTGVFFAGQLVALLFSGVSGVSGGIGGTWEYTREDLAHLVAIPLVQLAAVWIVVLVRRHSRESVKPPPPPAPEKPASRPDAEP